MPKLKKNPLDALELKPGQSIDLLKALHIVTREGGINQDSRRKLKQVYHLTHFIEPLIDEVRKANDGGLYLVDHGAGKSYLGFILYDLFIKQQPEGAVVAGVETRQELVDKSSQLASELGFDNGMKFINLPVAQATEHPDLPDQVDIVTALHACNTATDDAISFGLKKQAKFMVLVPCCQAEVATHLRKYKSSQLGKTSLVEMWRHPLHTREFGSQLTNVLRCLQLEAPAQSLAGRTQLGEKVLDPVHIKDLRVVPTEAPPVLDAWFERVKRRRAGQLLRKATERPVVSAEHGRAARVVRACPDGTGIVLGPLVHRPELVQDKRLAFVTDSFLPVKNTSP